MRLSDQVREERGRGGLKVFPTPTANEDTGPSQLQQGGNDLRTTVSILFPTPVCPAPHDSEESSGKIKARRDTYGVELTTSFDASTGAIINPGGGKAEPLLFPMPTTQDGSNDGGPSQFDRNTPPLNTMVKMLPTPTTLDAGTRDVAHQMDTRNSPGLDSITGLLPTPKGSDGEKGGPNQRGSAGDYALPAISNILATGKLFDHETAPDTQLLPTPSAGVFNDGEDPAQWEARQQALRDAGGDSFGMPLSVAAAMLDDPDHPVISWGDFEPAIRRWEAILGRPSPAPTEPSGKNGAHRLSPLFVEFMMGLPLGHVTAVPGLKRNAQLKALGNGVVPQQGVAAVRHLLSQRYMFAVVDASRELVHA